MTLAGIWALLCPALLFALGATALWGLLRWATRHMRRPDARREVAYALAAFYLAALVEIIALRLGRTAAHAAPQCVPLRTSIAQFRAGAWPFLYHVAGNLIWFVPLGMLLPRLWPRLRFWQAVLGGAVLSLLLESCQYILGTGVADVDDVLLNALGTALGWAVGRFPGKRQQYTARKRPLP